MSFESSEAVIRYRNGLELTTESGTDIVADGRGDGDSDIVFLSHAHTDHLISANTDPVICSPITAELAKERMGISSVTYRESAPNIDLLASGHIIGSRAALIEDTYRYLYTGDVCTRDRLYLDGFDPVDADVLLLESTYGRPQYEFPPHDALEADIIDWITDHRHRPLLLFGYPLGRAQKLHQLAIRSQPDRILVHDSIMALNRVIESVTDLSFPASEFQSPRDVGPGDVVILPTTRSRSQVVDRLVDRAHAVRAGFSGWAADNSYRFRGNFDAAFPLSDHCDFPELLDLVRAVDPEIVYTHHGFTDSLATEITTRLGIEARPLRKHQTTLSDY